MLNYEEYRKSISDELMAIRNRVRCFVTHWSEDGRYKEIILRNTLINHLPQTVSVGTGFVIGGNNEISKQIDIIVYLKTFPPIFRIDDFVIVVKESVIGIIEVKTKIEKSKFKEVIKKAHDNGKLIGGNIFNGIFGYESDIVESLPDTCNNPCSEPNRENLLTKSIKDSLNNYSGYVNNIALGEDVFVKYWLANKPEDSSLCEPPNVPHYSFYGLKTLAFGYFISNLIEDVYNRCERSAILIEDVYNRCEHSAIPGTLSNALYPIEGTKETRLIGRCEIRCGNIE